MQSVEETVSLSGAGPAAALASAALFGLSVTAAKAFVGRLDAAMTAGLLYLGCGAGLAIWARVRRGREASLRLGDAGWLLGSVAFGGVLGPVLLMLALKRGPASEVSLLLNLEAPLTALTAAALFREPLGRRFIVALCLTVAGGALLSGGGGGGVPWSCAALVAGACLCWAADNNCSQPLSQRDPAQVGAVKGLAAGTFSLSAALLTGGGRPGIADATLVVAVGALGYGLSLVLYLAAQRRVGAARTALFFALGPLIGSAGAVVFLGEPLTARLAAAAVLMAAASWIALHERHHHAHDHREAHEHRHRHDEHHHHEHETDPRGDEHSHWHSHVGLSHDHPHSPDIHHRAH